MANDTIIQLIIVAWALALNSPSSPQPPTPTTNAEAMGSIPSLFSDFIPLLFHWELGWAGQTNKTAVAAAQVSTTIKARERKRTSPGWNEPIITE